LCEEGYRPVPAVIDGIARRCREADTAKADRREISAAAFSLLVIPEPGGPA